jgi:pimeloyl-ACP methyl ester carboxylesterase
MWEEKLVQTGKVRLNLATGPDNGPPILLLHGVARSWRDFAPVLPALAARNRVLALDHRGHGRSERAGSYLVTDYVRDTVAFLRNYQSRPAVLWGHSLGAMVAAAAAAHVPARVGALILEDPPFHTMGERITPALRAFFAGLQECAREDSIAVPLLAERMAAIRLPIPDGRTVRLDEVRDATQIRFGARCLVDLDPAVLDPVVTGSWLEGYDLEGVLQQVRCPTLLLAGQSESGAMLSPYDAARVTGLVEDLTQVSFEGAGHLLHWQRTDDVLRHVLAFLESH